MDDNKLVYELTTAEFDVISRDLRSLKRVSEKTNNFFDYKVINVPNSNAIYLIFKLDPDSINRFNAGSQGQLKLKLLADIMRVSSNKDSDDVVKSSDGKARFIFNWLDSSNQKDNKKINLDLLQQMRTYSENGDPNLSDIKCIVCGRKQKGRRSMFAVKVEGSQDYKFIGSSCVNLYIPKAQRMLIEKIMNILLLLKDKKSISYKELPAVPIDKILDEEIELFIEKIYGVNYNKLVNDKIQKATLNKNTKPEISNVLNSSIDTIEEMIKSVYNTDAIKFDNSVRQNILKIIFAEKNEKGYVLELIEKEFAKVIGNNFDEFYHDYCLTMSKYLNNYYEHGNANSMVKLVEFDKLVLANSNDRFSLKIDYDLFGLFERNFFKKVKVYKDDFSNKDDKTKKLINIVIDKNGVDALPMSSDAAKAIEEIKSSGKVQEAKELQDKITKRIEDYRNGEFAKKRNFLIVNFANALSTIVTQIFYLLSQNNNNKLLFPYNYQKDTISFTLANAGKYGSHDEVFKMIKDDFLKSIKASRSLTQSIINAREFIMAAQEQDGKILALTANDAHKAIKKALTSSQMTSSEFGKNDLSFMKNYNTQVKCFLKFGDLNKVATFYDALIDKEFKAFKNLISASFYSNMTTVYINEVNEIAAASYVPNKEIYQKANGKFKKVYTELVNSFNKHTNHETAKAALINKLKAVQGDFLARPIRQTIFDDFFDVKVKNNVNGDKIADNSEDNPAMAANFYYTPKENFVLARNNVFLPMFNFKETVELIPENKEIKFHVSVEDDGQIKAIDYANSRYFSTPFFSQERANSFTKDSIYAFVSYYSYLFVKKYYQEVAEIAKNNGFKFTPDIKIKHDQSQLQKYATYEILCRKLLSKKTLKNATPYNYNSSLLGNYAFLDVPYLTGDGIKIESEGLKIVNLSAFVEGDYSKFKLTAYTPISSSDDDDDDFAGYYQDFEFSLGGNNGKIILPVSIKAGEVTTTLSEEKAQEVYHKVISFITKNTGNNVLDSLKLDGPSEPQVKTVSLNEFKKLF